MNDYILRVDTLEVLRNLKIKHPLDSDRYILREIEAKICDMPAVDVVEVVRCKDCRYWDTRNFLPSPDGKRYGECKCPEQGVEVGDSFDPEADFFCAYGERKTDNGVDKGRKNILDMET